MVTPVSLNGAYCATAALVAIVDANSAAIKVSWSPPFDAARCRPLLTMAFKPCPVCVEW